MQIRPDVFYLSTFSRHLSSSCRPGRVCARSASPFPRKSPRKLCELTGKWFLFSQFRFFLFIMLLPTLPHQSTGKCKTMQSAFACDEPVGIRCLPQLTRRLGGSFRVCVCVCTLPARCTRGRSVLSGPGEWQLWIALYQTRRLV